jgi:Ferritin-like domain
MNRRETLARLGLGLSAVLVFRAAHAQGGTSATALQLLLRLEWLKVALYDAALAVPEITDELGVEAVSSLMLIRDHAAAHAELLEAQLGATAPPRPEPESYDLTAGGAFPDVLLASGEFLKVAQLLEDLAVRAYKESLAAITAGGQVLELVARLHQVEARHAAQVRRLRGQPGWIDASLFDFEYFEDEPEERPQATVARMVYGDFVPEDEISEPSPSEDNRVQAHVRDLIPDPFDEPLEMSETTDVLALFGA